MSQIAKKISSELCIKTVSIDSSKITATISDGRIVSIPLTWFEKLSHASKDQLLNFQISPSGYGIHWPDLDEDISINAFIG